MCCLCQCHQLGVDRHTPANCAESSCAPVQALHFLNLWPLGGGAESVVCGCIGLLLPCRVCSEGFVEFWKELVSG